MRSEEVFSMLVEANPVPNPTAYVEALADASNASTVLEPRRENMQSLDQPRNQTQTPRRGLWPVLAAMGLLIVGLAVVIMTQPGAEPDAAGELGDVELAVARAEQFLAARNATEFQAAAGSEAISEADLLMWEWMVALDEAGYLGEYGDCRADDSAPVIRVECDFASSDPVWIAFGLEVTQPFNFYPDRGDAGQLEWRAWGGDNPGRAIRAYADYLRLFAPDVFESACSPSAYELGSIETYRGLALTPQCAEQLIPHIPAIADWVEQGQPTG